MRLPAFAPLLLLATAATAQQPDAPAPEKKICHTGEAKTGSFLRPKRECHTAAEWAALAQENKRNAPPVAPPQMEMMNVGGQR